MIVQSLGTVAGLLPPGALVPGGLLASPGSLSRWSAWGVGSPHTYAEMYRAQPNVRTCVDFIARNIAQLNVHAYRRVSDTDRERIVDHAVIKWLNKPNPSTTGYRLLESLMKDIGIFFNAYWLKVRNGDGSLVSLIRLRPTDMRPVGNLLVTGFVWTAYDGQQLVLDPRDVVYFGGYDPFDPEGLSPLETLRQTLAEECAATGYRESFWNNAARLEGVIERPATAPKWSPEQKQSFREQWQARFAGPGNAGQTAVLEDGMTLKPMSESAKDSEYVASRKLTREEVARAYHIPLPMVGILDYATFSNIKEQHKQLYQDSLGPWLTYLQDEFERQLLPESTDDKGVYLEFNLTEKLKGSFEEQAAALQVLVGRPVMTANEGRARLNLPSIKDDPTADQLSAPLNTTSGYGGSVKPTEPTVPAAASAAVIRASWDRQRRALERVEPAARVAAFDTERWDRELASDLRPLYLAAGYGVDDATREASALATRVNTQTLDRLSAHDNPFSTTREASLYE